MLFQCHHTYTPNNLSLYSPRSLLPSQEVQSLPSIQLYKSQKPTSQTWGLSRWKKAENCFKIHCTTSLWYREHRPKHDAGKPNRAYRIQVPSCVTERAVERPEELLPCPAGTRSTQTVPNPVNSAVSRDSAGCHTSATNTSKSSGFFFFEEKKKRSSASPQLGFTMVCVHVVWQDLRNTEKGELVFNSTNAHFQCVVINDKQYYCWGDGVCF